MDDAAAGDGLRVCPHIDLDDHRCNSRFRLERIEQALGVCFHAFHACPMFHELNVELEEVETAARPAPLIMVTAHGSPVPLRATGT